MIRFENLSKEFRIGGRRKVVARNINATFPSGVSVGLLGRNGTGKSTLMKLIAGEIDPTGGRIVSTGAISWQVGFAGSFHPELSGLQNTKFLARIYGVDTDELVDFVEDFAALGQHFRLPFRSYSAGMRSRLAFGVCMGIPFDTYLVDEVTSVGDAAFQHRSTELFQARMANAGAVVVSHSMALLRQICQHAAVLENGEFTYYTDIEAAIEHHERNVLAARL